MVITYTQLHVRAAPALVSLNILVAQAQILFFFFFLQAKLSSPSIMYPNLKMKPARVPPDGVCALLQKRGYGLRRLTRVFM